MPTNNGLWNGVVNSSNNINLFDNTAIITILINAIAGINICAMMYCRGCISSMLCNTKLKRYPKLNPKKNKLKYSAGPVNISKKGTNTTLMIKLPIIDIINNIQ